MVTVPTMRGLVYLDCARTGELELVELPYDRPEVTMTLVIPPRGQFEEFGAELSAAGLESIVSVLKGQERYVDLRVPKLRFETDLDLTAALGAAGLDALFDETRAELSGISPEPGLHPGAVLHRTFLSVDEWGTEAAAATVSHTVGGLPPEPVVVDVDRPFFFFIRDRPTGACLFFGRVLDPTGG